MVETYIDACIDGDVNSVLSYDDLCKLHVDLDILEHDIIEQIESEQNA